MAVDGAGNVYVADTNNNRVVKETLAGGAYSQSTLVSNLTFVVRVAVDGSGNVFACGFDSGMSNSVVKLDVADAPSLAFPTTNVGSASSVQTVTVENIGNTPLSFPIPASGNNPSISANFDLDSTGSAACPLVGSTSSTAGTLAAGSSCQLPISFAPVTGGDITGAVVLTDISLNAAAPGYASQSIALSGTALDLPVLVFGAIAPQTYGNAPFTISATSDSSGAVTYAVVSGPATISGATVTLTGAGTVVLSASQAASGNYRVATATTSFTVATAVPTLVFAAIAPQTYGNAPFTVSATSASSGAVTYAVVSGLATISGATVTLTGAGTVVLSATQAASGNYASATATTSFTVAAEVFTVAPGSSSSSSATAAPGGSAAFTLTLTPGAGTSFPNAVTFSITGLPTGATATFSPASLPAGSGATTVMLTVQTSAAQARKENSYPGGGIVAAVALGFLMLPWAGMGSARRRLRQMPRLAAILAVAALGLGAAMSLIGCSGGGNAASSTPPAQSYALVVTATDATTGAKSSTSLTLTVE